MVSTDSKPKICFFWKVAGDLGDDGLADQRRVGGDVGDFTTEFTAEFGVRGF